MPEHDEKVLKLTLMIKSFFAAIWAVFTDLLTKTLHTLTVVCLVAITVIAWWYVYAIVNGEAWFVFATGGGTNPY